MWVVTPAKKKNLSVIIEIPHTSKCKYVKLWFATFSWNKWLMKFLKTKSLNFNNYLAIYWNCLANQFNLFKRFFKRIIVKSFCWYSFPKRWFLRRIIHILFLLTYPSLSSTYEIMELHINIILFPPQKNVSCQTTSTSTTSYPKEKPLFLV